MGALGKMLGGLSGQAAPNPQNLAQQKLSNPLAGLGSPSYDILGAQLPGQSANTGATPYTGGDITVSNVRSNPANKLDQNQNFWQRFLHSAVQGVGQNLQNNAASAQGGQASGVDPRLLHLMLQKLLQGQIGGQQGGGMPPMGGPPSQGNGQL